MSNTDPAPLSGPSLPPLRDTAGPAPRAGATAVGATGGPALSGPVSGAPVAAAAAAAAAAPADRVMALAARVAHAGDVVMQDLPAIPLVTQEAAVDFLRAHRDEVPMN